MKKFIAFIMISSFSILAYANSPEMYAKIAREVAKVQGMSDYNSSISTKLSAMQQPTLGEGFYPNTKLDQNNPYLKNLYEWADKLLQTKPNVYGKSVKDVEIFNVLGGSNPNYGTRTEMHVAKNIFFLVTHKDSKYYGNEELFRRYLSRVLAYANEYNIHVKSYNDKLNDFFAIGPALYILRMTSETYGDYLLPSQKLAIDDCMKKALDFWKNVYNTGKDNGPYKMGKYANRDLGVANILINAGLYCNDKEAIDIAKWLVAAQKENSYADGGFAYIGTQNESATYHAADTFFLTRFYASTKDENAKELLTHAKNCPLLENEPDGLGDFYTAPSWKHTWNYGNFSSLESVNYFNDSPYLRMSLDNRFKGAKILDAMEIPFYKAMSAKKLPNNYTVIDRNLAGFRARYNDFSVAATLREIGEGEPGHATLVGAMSRKLVGNKPAIDSMVMLARPTVTAQVGNKKLPAFITDDLKSDMVIGKNYAAFGAIHNLATWGSSRKGKVLDFEGTQLYLSAKDHFIGVMQVSPKGEQKAYTLGSMFRLGYGGFTEKNASELIKISDKEYSYGNLRIRFLATNFPDFKIIESKVRADSRGAIAHDFTFSVGSEENLKSFSTSDKYYIAYEVYPKSAENESVINKIDNLNGLNLDVQIGEFNYKMSYNSANNKLNFSTNDSEKAWKNFDEVLEKSEAITDTKSYYYFPTFKGSNEPIISIDGETIPAKATGITLANGINGKALLCDGTGGFAINKNLELNDQFTYSLWVNPTISDRSDYINYKGNILMSINGVLGEHLGGWWTGKSAPNVVVKNVWSHVAVTFKNPKLKMYVNGKIVFEGEKEISQLQNDNIINFFSSGTDNRFKGLADEIKIYNIALDDNAILNEYNKYKK